MSQWGWDYPIYEMENKKMFETTNQSSSFPSSSPPSSSPLPLALSPAPSCLHLRLMSALSFRAIWLLDVAGDVWTGGSWARGPEHTGENARQNAR